LNNAPDSFGKKEFRLGSQVVLCDREATIAAYKKTPLGGADECSCIYCKNFAQLRDKAYPIEFLAVLDQLGIDWKKETEVYELGAGRKGTDRLYGGWFDFVGEAVTGVEETIVGLVPEGFTFRFEKSSLVSSAMPPGKTLQVCFNTYLSWVLPEDPE
jgi:hypothetical protein